MRRRGVMICKSTGEKVWIATSLSVFFAHRALEGGGSWVSDDGFLVFLQLLMIVASFPLGAVAIFVVALSVQACGSCDELRWMLDWSTLLVAGYIQWFWIVPEIRKHNHLTLLKLEPPAPAKMKRAARVRRVELTTPPATPGVNSCTITFASAPARAVASEETRAGNPTARRSPHFDESELTPLEKVLAAR
jgi:hypothetical protein